MEWKHKWEQHPSGVAGERICSACGLQSGSPQETVALENTNACVPDEPMPDNTPAPVTAADIDKIINDTDEQLRLGAIAPHGPGMRNLAYALRTARAELAAANARLAAIDAAAQGDAVEAVMLKVVPCTGGTKQYNAIRDAIAALVAWTDADQPLPEDAEIQAEHPMKSKRDRRHEIYGEALRLVGAKRSKYALVDLVNWLLSKNAALVARADAEAERAERAELDKIEIGTQLVEAKRSLVNAELEIEVFAGVLRDLAYIYEGVVKNGLAVPLDNSDIADAIAAARGRVREVRE